MGRILAAGDIGSNTAHLLIAEVDQNEKVNNISDSSHWLGIGEIVAREGQIPQSTETELARVLAAFVRLARYHHAESIYVFGTEALRKASNGTDVLKRLKKETGVSVDLIGGAQEAELGLGGAWIDGAGTAPFLFCEIGGGSAQIALCDVKADKPHFDADFSLPLGTGTLIGRFNLQEGLTESKLKEVSNYISEQIASTEIKQASRILACGGVARGAWRALHPDGDREIHVVELDYLIWATARLTYPEIAARFGVKLKRAATLLPGALVAKAAMLRIGKESLLVSRYGVREGAIKAIAQGTIKTWPL